MGQLTQGKLLGFSPLEVVSDLTPGILVNRLKNLLVAEPMDTQPHEVGERAVAPARDEPLAFLVRLLPIDPTVGPIAVGAGLGVAPEADGEDDGVEGFPALPAPNLRT